MITLYVVATVEGNYILILSIEVAAALADVAGVALLAEVRPVAGIELEANGRVDLKALDGIHADTIEEVRAEEHAGRGQQHQRFESEFRQRQIGNSQAEQLPRSVHGGVH